MNWLERAATVPLPLLIVNVVIDKKEREKGSNQLSIHFGRPVELGSSRPQKVASMVSFRSARLDPA